MYKVIPNEKSLEQFESETKDVLSLWKNRPAVESIQTMANQLDTYYGAQRDIVADLGGYIIILYGEPEAVENENDKILNYHNLQKDLYEFEEKYENDGEMAVIRLYLCSCDYAVLIVSVQPLTIR